MIESPPPWYRQIATAVSKHIVLKAIGTPLFIAIFFSAYFYLLKHPAFPVTIMPFTAFDRLISYQPLAMPLYLSLWLYISIPPSLLVTGRTLFNYLSYITATCLIGLIIFYFWPTAVPAATTNWAQHPSMNYLKSIDATGNAFPSLHVATAIFSAIWLDCILKRFNTPRGLLMVNWAWCAGITYSTLATHQHVIADVLAGLILGASMAKYALRTRSQHAI